LGIVAVSTAAVPAVADPSVGSKQAEAQRVLGEIQQLDSSLERARQAYDAANVKLAAIKQDLQVNTHDLRVARGNLKQAQLVLARRLVALYTADQDTSVVSVLLGAKNLDDVINRLDTVNRVSAQDTHVLDQVRHFRRAVEDRQRSLQQAKASQAQLVAQRAAERESIQGKLAREHQLLGSIRDEIARIQAAEAARQARLAAEARARLEAQQRAQRQAAAEQQPVVVGASAATPEGITVAPPSHYSGVVGIAMQYLGTPYVWGGASPGGFDCSGFVMYVYAQVGVYLPHNAAAQYGAGVPVSADQLEPGDLVFFDGLGHVGIYIGGGQFIHSPHTGDVVKISSLSESWYASTFVGARRIL
jgi:peptidoglycan DL-endopeptidase CwlO